MLINAVQENFVYVKSQWGQYHDILLFIICTWDVSKTCRQSFSLRCISARGDFTPVTLSKTGLC